MTLRNLDRWVRGMRDGMAGLKKPQAAEVERTLTIGSGQRRPFFSLTRHSPKTCCGFLAGRTCRFS